MSDIFPSAYSLRFTPARLTRSIDWHGHLCFAAWLMQLVRPASLVELGVFRGDSLATFAQAAKELGVKCAITGVDTWGGDETTGKYSEEVYADIKDHFDVNHPEVTLFRSLFDDALPSFADGSIDVLHIDGCHVYEAVKHDFETWRRKMSRRGVILFHDIAVVSGGFGTRQFWDEARQQHPSFAFQHSNGLGVLLYGPEQPAELRQLAEDPERLEVVRAAFEATGAKFFHRAKERWWRSEAEKHAAYSERVSGELATQLAAHFANALAAQAAAQPALVPRAGERGILRRAASRAARMVGIR